MNNSRKIYDISDIKVLDILSHVKKHPEMYFGNVNFVNDIHIFEWIVREAAIEIGKLTVEVVADFWVIVTDKPWFIKENHTLIEYFKRGFPFPEGGENMFTCGPLIYTYADNILIHVKDKFEWIKNDENINKAEIEKSILSSVNGKYAIAFKKFKKEVFRPQPAKGGLQSIFQH